MTKPITVRRVSHPNLVVEDHGQSLAHFQEVYGGRMILDLPKDHWHAYLVEIGGMILEIFAPSQFMLHQRIGPHLFGIEYEADMAEVREVIAARGIRIIRDIEVALHTHPADCLGIDLEFYRGSFYTPNTPHLTTQLQSAAYWRDEHPLGMMGLKAYTVAVSDGEAASCFFQDFIGAEPVYQEGRPHIGARAIGLQAADCLIDVLSPTGEGALRRELERGGRGMYSLVFRVQDIGRARAHFADCGIGVVDGSREGRIAVPAEANLGIVFEFEE